MQGQQPGNDEKWGKDACAVRAEFKDEAVTRYRPLLIRAEKSVDPASARQRAAWEKSVRAARSVTLKVKVQGFRQGKENAPLWALNSLVDVDVPYLRISQRLLVSKISFRRDISSGSITELELRDPAAFQPEPKKAQGSAKSGKASAGKSAGPVKVAKEQDIQTRMANDAAATNKKI